MTEPSAIERLAMIHDRLRANRGPVHAFELRAILDELEREQAERDEARALEERGRQQALARFITELGNSGMDWNQMENAVRQYQRGAALGDAIVQQHMAPAEAAGTEMGE